MTSSVTYDSIYYKNEQIAEKRTIEQNGEISRKHIYSFNENKLTEKIYFPDTLYRFSKIYEFDSNCSLISKKELNPNGSWNKDIFYYDDNNILTKIVHQASSREDNGYTGFQYKFDKEGNWIELIVVKYPPEELKKKGMPTKVKYGYKREIKYK